MAETHGTAGRTYRTRTVAVIADRGATVPAMGCRGYRTGACIALLVVLQSYADNIQPLQATLTGPGAVLVNSTNGFILNITGGERPYVVEWWRGSQCLGSNTVSGAGMAYAYVAPDDPKQETLTAFVNDARPDPPRQTYASKQFWQV